MQNLPKSKLIKIGEASKLLGISIDTLRRWEKRGWIRAIKTPGGTRYYDLNQIKKVNPTLNPGRRPDIFPETLKPQISQSPDLNHYSKEINTVKTTNLIEELIKKDINLEPSYVVKDHHGGYLSSLKKARKQYIVSIVLLAVITAGLLSFGIKNNQSRSFLTNIFKAEPDQVPLSSTLSLNPDFNPVVGLVLAESTPSGRFLEINTDTKVNGQFITSDLRVGNNATIDGSTTFNTVTYSWPNQQGVASTFLQNNGSGALAWAPVPIPPTASTTVTGIASFSDSFFSVTSLGAVTVKEGGITTTEIKDGTIANGDLANSKVTITAGTGLSGGGDVSLGSSVTLSSTLGTSVDLTSEVTGVLPIANGGSNKALTLAAGGVLWTDSDSFEVSAAGTSGQVLTSAGTGAPTWTTVSGLGVSWSSLTDPSANLSLAHGTNTTTFASTATTETFFTMTGNSLTSGTALALSSSATAFTGELASITLSGNNAANTGTLLEINNTGGTSNANTSLYIKHYGDGSGSLAFRIDDVSGDTTPFIVTNAGNVGVGLTTTSAKLHVGGSDGGTTLLTYSGPPISSFATNPQAGINNSINSFSSLNSTDSLEYALSGINQDNLTTNNTIGVGGLAYATNTSGVKPATYGVYGAANNGSTGTVTKLSALYSFAFQDGAGTASTMAGLYVDSNSRSAGTVTLNAGVYIADQSGVSATATSNYQIYSAGTAASYFAGNIGINDTIPDAYLDIDSTRTTGLDFLITNTGIGTSGSVGQITANSYTSGDIFTLSATALTTGSLAVLTGPSGGTAGVTDAALKISSDVGNIGTSNGLISSTAVFDGTSATGVNLYLTSSDAIASANTDYGIYNSVTNTGAIDSAITKTSYGSYTSVSSTLGAPTTAGTTNVYGQYITTTATHAADFGTVNNYGLYVANGTSSTNGASTKYGIYLESQTGADTNLNYSIYSAGGTNYFAGNVGIGAVTPAEYLQISTAQATANLTSTTGTNYNYISFTNTGGTTYIGNERSTTGALCGSTIGYAFTLCHSGAQAMQFGTTNAVRMTIAAGGNVGIGDTTPDALLDIDSTSTTGLDFLITNTGVGLSGTVATITANSYTSGDIFSINATGLTTGTAMTLSGPTSTGVTDHFVKLTADVGSAASLLNLNPDFSGSAVTGYGIYNTATDATANANTDYGYYGSLALTGDAAKTGVGIYSTVTSSSTTGDTLIGLDLATTVTGILAGATTRDVYGARIQPTAGAESAAGTTNVYGVYTKATADVAVGGTLTTYGAYIANGGGDAEGTTTNYGLYIEDISGADTNIDLNFTASPIVRIGDAGVLTFTEAGGNNTLCTITDSSNVGNLSCTGNITGSSSGTVGFWTRTSTTLDPATDNDIVSIPTTNTTGADLAITNTGIYTGTGAVNITANSATSGDILALNGTALTSGSLAVLTGPSGGTAGVTDAALKISSDVGNIGTSNGLISSTATIDSTANAISGVNLYLSTASSQALGTTVGQTYYGMYNTLAKTGADTTSGTITSYGTYSTASNTGGDTAGTRVTYGGYFSATGDASGTTTAVGLYATAASADNNYAGIFDAGNVGIGSTAPATKLDIDTGSNTLGLRLRGTAETTEISDLYVGSNGELIISNTAGADTAQYIDLRPEDNEYGVIIRDGTGGSTDPFLNIYANNAATDYVNLVANTTNATAGLVIDANQSIGVGDTDPDAKFDIDSSATTGNIFGILSTTLTTGEIADITGTWAPTDGSDNEAIDINLTFTPTTSAATFRGLDLNVTEGANALANTDYALKVTLDNSANTSTGTHTVYGGHFTAAGKTAGTTTAVGLYATASGADNNYAAIFEAGNVGIGDTTPAALFTVGSGDMFQVNSSGHVGLIGGGANEGYALNITGTLTAGGSATIQRGINFGNLTVTNTATSQIDGIYLGITTPNAVYTTSNLYGVNLGGISKGASHTITAAAQLAIAEIDTSISSNNTNLLIGTQTIPSGSYSIYNPSTKQNYFAGKLGIGADTTPDFLVDIQTAAGDSVVIDASTTANTTTTGVMDINVTSLTHDNRGLDLSYTSTAAGATTTVTQYGIASTLTSTQAVTATSPTFTYYGNYQTVAKSGADNLTTGGTFNTYGIYGTASNTSTDAGAAGTRSTYGGYFSATGAAGGTTTAYGLYTTASGADTNYAIYADAGLSSFGADANGRTVLTNRDNGGVGEALISAESTANSNVNLYLTPKGTGEIALNKNNGRQAGGSGGVKIYDSATTAVMTVSTGGNVGITSSNATGNGTSSSLSLAANSVNTGTALKVDTDALTTGNVFEFEQDSRDMLALNDRELTVGGHTDLTTLANIVDTFVYDTTGDADGGRWTDDDRARASSWYNETIDNNQPSCVLDTDDRCGQKPFPKKAIIVATTTKLYIFDAKDNTLWMDFRKGALTTSQMIGQTTNSTLSSVFALNGKVYVGNNGSVGEFFVIDFKTDTAKKYNATDDYQADKVIGSRNSTIAWDTASSSPIADTIVNDVHAQIVNGKTYVAVANDTSVSVIHETDSVVYSYSDVTADDYNNSWIGKNGDLWALNETLAQLERWNNVVADSASELNGTPDNTWDETTSPALANAAPTIQASSPDNLYVQESASTVDGKSPVVYIGTNKGVSIVNTKAGDQTNGSVKYANISYITEELIGDTRFMAPQNGSGSLAASTTISGYDASVKANAFTTFTGSSMVYSSGVRGTGITWPGNGGDYICSGTTGTCADDTDLDLTGSAISVGTWVYFDNAGDSYDGLITKESCSATTNYDLRRVRSGAGGDFTFCIGNGTSSFDVRTNGIITATTGRWYFVVGTFDGTNLKIYVNGNLIATDSTFTGSPNDNATPVTIGIENTASSTTVLEGKIDEPFITAETLTASQIKNMYQVGLRALQNHTASRITGLTAADGYQELAESSDTVRALTLDEGGRYLYAGTNSGSDTGGVSVIGTLSDTLVDVFASTRTRTDDDGTAWNDDDILSISVSGTPSTQYNSDTTPYSRPGLLSIGTAAEIWAQSEDFSIQQFLANSYNPFGVTLNQSNVNVDSVLRVVNQISTRLDELAIGSGSTGVTEPYLAESFRVDSNGSLLSRSLINSTTAMQFQNAAGTTILNIDTTNGNVGIGNSAPGTKLDVTGTGRFSSTLTASSGFTVTTGTVSITASDGSFVDLSAVNGSSTTEGLKLPQATDCTTQTAEGLICWDSDTDALRVGNGATTTAFTASPFVATTGVIDYATATDRLKLTVGEVGDVGLEVLGKSAQTAAGIFIDARTSGANASTGGIFKIDATSATTNSKGSFLDYIFTSTGATSSYGDYIQWRSSVVVTGADVSQSAYGSYVDVRKTGADDATGTYSLYGSFNYASNTGRTAAGTVNTYGGYFDAVGDTSGTTNAYGIYIDSPSGADNNYGIYSTMSAAASTTAYAVYADAGAGAGTEYAGVFLNGNVGIGTSAPATKLDVYTGSNSIGLRLRGVADTTEISDIYVGTGGELILSNLAGGDANQYIDLYSEDNDYGLILRNSLGTSTVFTNFYMNDSTVDYLNIVSSTTNSTVGLVLDANQNVGINTTDVDADLELSGALGTGNNFDAYTDYILILRDEGTSASSYGIGVDDTGQIQWNTNGTYGWFKSGTSIATLDGSGNLTISGECNDATAGTTCADYAEVYQKDINDPLDKGDLLAFNKQTGKVTKAGTPNSSGIMGVYSTSPGSLIGHNTGVHLGAGSVDNLAQDEIPVALTGRAPLKVSTENGPIQIGDFLTQSSIPGVAMKATQPGPTVGKALENHNGSEIKKIMTFVNVSYADPSNALANLTLDTDGTLIVPKLKAERLVLSSELVVGSIKANSVSIDSSTLILTGTLASVPVSADNKVSLADAINSINDSLQSTEYRLQQFEATNSARLAMLEAERAQIAGLSSQVASTSANLASSVNQTSSALSSLQSQIDSLLSSLGGSSESTPSAQLPELTPIDTLFATGSATLANLEVTSEATISGQLLAYGATIQDTFKSLGNTLLGSTTVAGDLIQDGTLSITEGAKINALPILYFQDSPLANGVDFFNGKVVIDKTGLVSIESLALGNQSLGTAIIKAGQTELVINNLSIKPDSKIFLTPTTVLTGNLIVEQLIPGISFKVKLTQPNLNDINFNWLVIQNKEASN